jgi:Anti-sigma factor NepR
MSPTLRTIIDLNIKRYRELLEIEIDHTKRETIIWLLVEEEAKLARMDEDKPPDIRNWCGLRPSVNHLKAVRTGIGAAVRALHCDVLRQAVPDRIAELLRQIDQQKDADGG